jgi:hypothetical protein
MLEVIDKGGRPAGVNRAFDGRLVVQKYLESRNAPAGVLMASTLPQGILRASMRIWRRHPWRATRANTFGQSHQIFNIPRLAREILYCEHTPEPIVESGAARQNCFLRWGTSGAGWHSDAGWPSSLCLYSHAGSWSREKLEAMRERNRERK